MKRVAPIILATSLAVAIIACSSYTIIVPEPSPEIEDNVMLVEDRSATTYISEHTENWLSTEKCTNALATAQTAILKAFALGSPDLDCDLDWANFYAANQTLVFSPVLDSLVPSATRAITKSQYALYDASRNRIILLPLALEATDDTPTQLVEDLLRAKCRALLGSDTNNRPSSEIEEETDRLVAFVQMENTQLKSA